MTVVRDVATSSAATVGRGLAAWTALALLASGCGDSDLLPADQGGPDEGVVMEDIGVDQGTDQGTDQGMPCDGPPGLYVEGSCSTLAPGVRPYRPRFELWSDAADKERFVSIPTGTQIDTRDPDNWVFPVGTVFWKTFSRNGRRLETRILTKTAEGEGGDVWTFETYGWNLAQDDVTRVGADGLENVLGTTHDIPSRINCLGCHAMAARDVGLGFEAIQLADANLPLSLDDLAAENEMSVAISIESAQVPGTAVERNALGYLHANCGHCHGGNAPPSGLNMQVQAGLSTVCETNTYRTALDATTEEGACVTPGADSFWPGASKRVLPGDHMMSAVYLRMSARGNTASMPPLGTEDPDAAGLLAVQQWINGIAIPTP